MSANFTYAPTTQADKDELYEWLKLSDAKQEGMELGKLRGLYAKLGWNDIENRVNQLKQDGKVNVVMRRKPGARVSFQYLVWV
jgi:hypothetical protein